MNGPLKYSLSLCLFGIRVLCAQINIANPSFEGPSGTARTPSPWVICGKGSPDTGPMQYNNMDASDGSSYLGLWNGSVVLATGEGATQELPCPLIAGMNYQFTLDLSGYSTTYKPGNLCIYGSNDPQCNIQAQNLLWRSDQMGQSPPDSIMRWTKYTVNFKPSQSYTHITFWSCDASAQGNEYISIDHISPIELSAELTVFPASCTQLAYAVFDPGINAQQFNFEWRDSLNQLVSRNKVQSGPLAPGFYTVEASIYTGNTCQQGLKRSFNISAPTVIEGALLASKDTICEKDSVRFTFLSPQNKQYLFQWPGSNSFLPDTSALLWLSDITDAILKVRLKSDSLCVKPFVYRIVKKEKPSAGLSSKISLCLDSSLISLHNFLGPNHSPDGYWIAPNGTPFNNPFNPIEDPGGPYKYVVNTMGCKPDTATLSIGKQMPAYAGPDTVLNVCSEKISIQLGAIPNYSHYSGRWKGSAPIDSLSGEIKLDQLVPGTYSFNYIVRPGLPCLPDTALINLALLPSPQINPGPIPGTCENTPIDIPLNISGGQPPFLVNYQMGSEVKSSLLANGLSPLQVQTSADATLTLLSIIESSALQCTRGPFPPIALNILESPKLKIDSLSCEPDQLNYRVYMRMTGGNSATYKINGYPVAGTQYTSPPIPSGQNFSFTLNDINQCKPESTVSGIKRCDCGVDAGTMAPGLLTICGDVEVKASAIGTVSKRSGDAVNYVLHDQAGRSLGQVLSINPTEARFNSSQIPGLKYNTRYYISRVVGQRKSDDSLLVDLSNPDGCMSVSAGQPVYFGQEPSVNFSLDKTTYCKGDTAILSCEFTAGLENFRLRFSNGMVLYNMSPSNNKILIPTQAVSEVKLTLIELKDTNACISSKWIEIKAPVYGFPDTSQLRLQCNDLNDAYQVSFNIVGGDSKTYKVNGVPSASAYAGPLLSSGEPYSISISDTNRCRLLYFKGSHQCPCLSYAGNFLGSSSDTLEACENQNINLIHQGNYFFDGNDVLNYLLCSDSSNPLASVLIQSPSPEFSQQSSILSETPYYVFPVVGDLAQNGLVNLQSSCLSIGAARVIRFRKPASLSFSTDAHQCKGQAVKLHFDASAPSELHFTLRVSDGSLQSFTRSGAFDFLHYPGTNFDTLIYSIDPGYYDPSLPTNCLIKPQPDPIYVINHSPPTARISGIFDLCLGDSIPIDIELTGDGVLNAPFSSSSYTGSVQGRSGTYKPVLTPSTTGVHTYTLTSVTDNTPAQCVGTVSGSAQITVRALPTASMSIIDPQVCRGESSGPQFVIAGQPNLSIFYRDQAGNTFSQTGLAPGTYSYPFVPAISTTFFLDSILDGTLSDATNKACKTTYLNQSAFVDVRPLPIGVLSGDTGICRGESASLRFDLSQSAPDAAPFSLVYQNTPSMGGSPVADSLSGLPLNSSIIVQPNDSTLYEPLRLYDRFGCRSINFSGRAQVDVYPIPLPVMAASDTASCMPLLTQLINLTDPSFTGTYTWDFGDGTSYTGSGQSQPIAHTYAQPGSYSVRLTVKSAQGCVKDSLIYNFLRAHPYPVAQFSYSPSKPTILEPELIFNNLSTLNYSNQWTFSTGLGEILGTSSLAQPSFRFPDEDSGTYSVKLRVESAFGCADSTKQQIFINGITESFIPSAFSPNGDGINEVFRPIHVGERAHQYEFSVYNRWGERIFYTTNPKEGWDGSYQGELCLPGSYRYILRVQSRFSEKERMYSGTITVLR